MTNTALRAENSNSRTITFKSKEHEKFYMEYLKKCRYQDVYHKALVYCLGIDRDTRENVNKIYNFKTGYVKTECLQEGWQTSGSLRIVRMAFNLYCNGTPSMLKIRLQGTLKDIQWFRHILEKHKELDVLEVSEAYANKGTSKYFRVYVEVEEKE